jgi:hypothetical protein
LSKPVRRPASTGPASCQPGSPQPSAPVVHQWRNGDETKSSLADLCSRRRGPPRTAGKRCGSLRGHLHQPAVPRLELWNRPSNKLRSNRDRVKINWKFGKVAEVHEPASTSEWPRGPRRVPLKCCGETFRCERRLLRQQTRSPTVRFSAIPKPLADARGSDRSRDREGAVHGNSTISHGRRPRRRTCTWPARWRRRARR